MKERELYLLGAAAAYYLLSRSIHVVTGLDVYVVNRSKLKLTWPVADDAGNSVGVITQEFKPGVHLGVDISVPGQYQTAKANVRAVAAGRVVRAWLAARGWAVLIDHGDWASGYLHMSSVRVSDGQSVAAGDVLGPMGADPLDEEHVVHLHLQLAPGGVPTDPAPYLEA